MSIIFLNGSGSSGKTSIARSIQHLSNEPWLRTGVDTFIDMLPNKFMGFGECSKDGYFSFVPGTNDRGPTMNVENGPLGPNFFDLAPDFAQMLADKNHNLIIDEVLFGDDLLKAYVQKLTSHKVYFIGVFCDLETMLEREILRGDRAIGLSNDQIDRVHDGIRPYDYMVDTSQKSPFTAAKEILEYMKTTPDPLGFKTIGKMF